MTTQPQWSSVDEPTADLLTLVADPERPVGRTDVDAFLDACRRDAMAHDGLVSVNRVREVMESHDIEHHRYSAFWSRFTGKDRPMVKADEWEVCSGSKSGNDGRPYRLRRWVGSAAA